MPAVGSPAPDFTLPNSNRQPVTLSGELEKGPVVIAFFPAAFSSTCTEQLCTLRDHLGEFATLGVQVLGVSVDTFFALGAFEKAEGFTFPLLSDFNKTVIVAYDVFNEDMIGLKGLAKRAVFLIDTGGIVRHREVLDDARLLPDFDALRRAVETL